MHTHTNRDSMFSTPHTHTRVTKERERERERGDKKHGVLP